MQEKVIDCIGCSNNCANYLAQLNFKNIEFYITHSANEKFIPV